MIHGVYWWHWQNSRPAPFRDRGYSLKEKPASMVMARWFLQQGRKRQE